jgi:two-component system chemotaxis response regulator CheB
MLDIARAGGATIAQDEQSSAVFGMPKRAIDLGAARQVLSLEQIGPALRGLVAGRALSTGAASQSSGPAGAGKA